MEVPDLAMDIRVISSPTIMANILGKSFKRYLVLPTAKVVNTKLNSF